MSLTLYQKIYDAHLIRDEAGETPLIYIDRHLVHEVTSPQAFDGLRSHNRSVRRTDRTWATMDHNTSTQSPELSACSLMAQQQLEALRINCQEFKVPLFGLGHPNQGIVHVIGPELGLTLPGTTIVCGDSHTATHGAFGALAFGIGTSEVEHVLATQTLKQDRARTMRITLEGDRSPVSSAKDIILAIAAQIGHAGGTGYVVEFSGDVIRMMSMEERMTLCNMAIEIGAKAGLIAPDQTTFAYLQGRDYAPKEALWQQAIEQWKTLHSDPNAQFDREINIDITKLAPQLTWGTNPGQVIAIDTPIPDPNAIDDPTERQSVQRALEYMDLKPNQTLLGIKVDAVFIGSCTNSRIEDLRAAAKIAQGKRVASHVRALVVPGSGRVKAQAEHEGLAQIFIDAGFEWRLPGCSMCLAMNDDRLPAGQRCASTSNRNFEGRQGRGSRTHLVSPAMAAAAAISGCFSDIRFIKES